MAMLAGLAEGVGAVLTYGVAFLFVLTVIVFVHELGHFLVARWFGVGVKAFSIGFGREIWGRTDRHGTRWRVAWIPLGGYVKFMDDENAASVPSREALSRMTPTERASSFHAKPVGQRAAIVAAGPIANFLLAILIFATMFLFAGVRLTTAQVDEVVPGTPAAQAGFEAGDVIRSIDGATIESFNDVLRVVGTSPEQKLAVTVERGGKLLELAVTPALQEQKDAFGGVHKRGVIGIKRVANPKTVEVRRVGAAEALWLGVKETHFIIASTLGYIRDVVIGRQSADQLGGPIRILDMSGEMAKLGPEYLIHFMGLISVSIGLINLFPIPLLDGGHLLYYAIEALRGRPLSERTQELGFRIGLSLVLLLMIFAFWNDGSVLQKWFPSGG